MEIREAKMQIAQDFINKYMEWLNDYNNPELTEREYANKSGWGMSTQDMKDLQKSMLWFHGHIFSGRYISGWKKDFGFELQTLVELHREGFLSYDYCSSWKARQLGKTDFYYINQNKAKEIYRAYKNGFFAKEVVA